MSSETRTAYHEAGHALIALALQLPIATVTIDPSGDVLGSVILAKPVNDTGAPLDRSLTPEDRATVGVWDVAWSIAGLLAEQLAFGSEEGAGCAGDLRKVAIAVERTDDAAGTHEWQWRRQTEECVERYLRTNWGAVTTLALALLAKRTMSGAEVRATVGDVPALDLRNAEGAVRYWSQRMAARVMDETDRATGWA